MRIRTLELRRYGPFRNHVLDFGDGTGLHLVFGPNEAGKSSALAALREFLFGIPNSTRGKFQLEYKELRIAALLELSDGQQLHCVRRKGKTNTLLDASDEKRPIDEEILNRELRGISKEDFARQFGIDYEQLHLGGEEIVRGQGDLSEALFAAAGGIQRLRAVRKRLEEQSKDLFLPSGSNPKINAALTALKTQEKKARDALLPSDRWLQMASEIAEMKEQAEKLDERVRELEQQRHKLQRIYDAVPLIAERCGLLESLGEVAHAPRLPADFPERRRQVQTGLQVASQMRQESETRIADLQRQIEQLDVPQSLLDVAADIEDLFQRLAGYRDSHARRQRLAADREALQRDVERLLRELGRDAATTQAEHLQVTRIQQERIQELGAQHSQLTAELEAARRDVTRLQRELADAEQVLETTVVPPDTRELEAAVRYVQKHVGAESEWRRLQGELQRHQADLDAQLQSLPLWHGSLPQLERLVVPSADVVSKFAQDFAQVDERMQRVADQRRELAEKAVEYEGEIKRLQQHHAVPSEQDLAVARRRRDEVGDRLRMAWSSNPARRTAAEPARSAAEPAGVDIVADWQEYEDLVRMADQIADRMRRDANLVAQIAQWNTELARCRERIEGADRELQELQRRRDELRDAWFGQWRPAGIEPQAPDAMLQWLEQRQQILQAAAELRAAHAVVEGLEEQVSELRDRLEETMRGVGLEPSADRRLAEWIEQAQLAIDALKQADQSRRDAQRDAQRLGQDLSAAEQELAAAQDRWADWTNQWAEAVAALQLEGDVTPRQATATLEIVRELNRKFERASELAEDEQNIELTQEAFREDVARTARATALELARRDAEDVVVELHKRLSAAQRADSQRAEKQKQLEQARERLQEACNELRKWSAELDVLCQEAQCKAPEELVAQEEQARTRDKLEERIQFIESQLHRAAGGATLEAFICQVGQYDADALPQQIQDLDEQIEKLREEQNALRHSIGGRETDFKKMDGSAEAAEARQEAERLRTTIQQQARAFIRLRLASAVLDRAMENYRSKNQGAVLQRASELFQTLTLGAFRGLQAEYGQSDSLVIVGVRPDGRTVGTEGMSEGTRDQLYLALRIATLERRLDAGQRLPLVVDDILIMFDDDRARAALKVLADVSARTQVIYFTHHGHLIELAREAIGDQGLSIHLLEPSQGPAAVSS
ncbi:MAG: hypothetical protein D6753_02420 [Planctomycetota bacterium]|nr:MAG: hypothetical protein D6753_02420 [Planctomycetota bacterium]